MAISIEAPPSREVDISSSPVIIFTAVLFLILSVGAYVLLFFLTQGTHQKLEEGKELLKTGVTSSRKELETKVLSYQQKSQDIVTLLERHNLPSVFFDSLEKTSHPLSQFTKLSFETGRGSIGLEGLTESFETLAQQTTLFQKEAHIKDIRFSRIQLSREGKIAFSMTLEISADFIKDKK